jgi:hypothetical protein
LPRVSSMPLWWKAMSRLLRKRQAFWHHPDRASGSHHDETSVSLFE